MDYPDFDTIPDDLKYGWGTGTDFVIEDRHNWQFTGRASPLNPNMDVPRGKVTGGTSAINGQVFLRPVAADFDYWTSLGNDEWSYQETLPYLRRMETDTDFSDDYHGSDGPIIVRRHSLDSLQQEQTAFYDACLALGFPENPDHNHPDAEGVGPYPLNNPGGVRWSTAIGYLSMARHRLNLTIRPNCFVRRVLFEGRRAVGVEAESGGETFRALRRRDNPERRPHRLPAAAHAVRRRPRRPPRRTWHLRRSRFPRRWARPARPPAGADAVARPAARPRAAAGSRSAEGRPPVHRARLTSQQRHDNRSCASAKRATCC